MTNKILALLVFLFCSINAMSFNKGLISNELSITDDIRKTSSNNYISDWRHFSNNNMTGVRVGRSNENYTSNGDFRIAISDRPVSMAVTTNKSGNLVDEPDLQEFGECSDFDANSPIGDCIIPMMLLLGLFVGVRKLK
ncbi:MAG: hypothetical protein KBT40_06860 [bacterium]|nr:hypothetical protein [Candidatus Minthenecus merdequi]